MIPVHYAALKDHEEVVGIFHKNRPETLTQPNDVSKDSWFHCLVTNAILLLQSIRISFSMHPY